MQAIEVKGFFTNYRGWIVLGVGLLLLVAVWITTIQAGPTDRDNDNDGATAIAVNHPIFHTLERADRAAQRRAAVPSHRDTGNATFDRADILATLRGERPVAVPSAATDRADTIQQLRAQTRQHTTPGMDRADMIELLRQTLER